MKLDNLGIEIKKNRKLLKLTQEQLAELIDVNPHYIYEIEKGLKIPSLSVLIAISEQLHVSIDTLLGSNVQNSDKDNDDLDRLIKNLNNTQRINLANVIRSLYPYLKL
ncbi:MAG: helix-turn-helix transcriptional regulator [Oscillospiraceae bacterium]|nr:helix-turn-helix transcriptional regulator [Oscillospiraceae bacterium]